MERNEVIVMDNLQEAVPSEYLEMNDVFKNARLGAFLIVPLKYSHLDELSLDWLEKNAELVPIVTPDLSDSVRKLLNSKEKDTVLRRYIIPQKTVLKNILGEESEQSPVFYACDSDNIAYTEDQRFTMQDMELYIFHTKVAFLCVKIKFAKMSVLDTIANLGYAENSICYFRETPDGDRKQIDLEAKIEDICLKSSLTLFNETKGSIFLEAYTYTTAVVGRRFKKTETMRQATFNLHLMVGLPEPVEDNSEADINYVYAVKDQSLGSYRWGSCITSQTISYVVARKDMDIDDELAEQAENGIPVVLLALYQKYTCLRYQEILSTTENFTPKHIKQMKGKLLDFQAFGTIAPANISRWHNIKQTYKYLLEENDIPEAVEKMSLSLNILADHQKEISEARSNAVLGLITLFGVVSIPSSIISIMDIMQGSNPINRLATVVSLISMVIMILVLLLYKRERR